MGVLILLALGLGVALSVYEFSPHTRQRIDDYARAIGSAYAVHRQADQHLSNASMATIVAEHHQARAQEAQSAPSPPRPFPPPVVVPAPVRPPPVVTQPPVVQPPVVVPEPTPTTPTPVPSPVPADVATATAHVDAAQQATDAAVESVSKAADANKEAAKNTAEAARRAKTQAERQQAAQSAQKVLENERQIADALKRLGIGACGVRAYSPITERARDALLAKLHADGMSVTGDNPWNIDPNKFGVKLRALWIPSTRQLKLIVTDKSIAGCSDIWEQIDPKIKEVM